MLDLAIRSTVVLAAAWAATAALRRASASTRYVVWASAIAAAAVIPVVSLVAPAWEVSTPAAVTSILPAAPGETALPAPRVRNTPERVIVDRSAAAPRRSIDYASVARAVWVAGASAILLYLAVGLLTARRIRRTATVADSQSVAELRTLVDAFGIGRTVDLVVSSRASSPIVVGILRPAIVLPRESAEWSEARRHVVLLHELAHVKRRDGLTQLLAHVLCAVYWFNPLAWIAARRLRTERERACDDVVLAAGTSAPEYAAHLLDIARTMQPGRLSPVAAAALSMARRTQLEGRLMAILDPSTRRSSRRVTRFAAAAALLSLAIPVAAIQSAPSATAARGPLAAIASGAVSTPARLAEPSQLAETLAATARHQALVQSAPPSSDDAARAALNRSLIEFAGDGDIDAVQSMLFAGADINARVGGDGTPLIAAAGDGHAEVVRLLLDRGADPNLVVPGEGTALIAAAGDGHVDVLRVLLDRGASVDLAVPGEGTALIAAANDGHVDAVRLLLERGSNSNMQVEGEGTALIAAADEGYGDVVRVLLEHGADPHLAVPGEGTALMAAAREGRLDIVRLLLDRGVDPNASLPGDGTALIEAASEGLVDVAETLLQRGAAVNLVPQGGETALIRAADEGYLPMVQLLVKNGADVNHGVWVIRTNAVWFTGDRSRAVHVTREEPELRTPLSAAREDGHADVVDFLISAGARD